MKPLIEDLYIQKRIRVLMPPGEPAPAQIVPRLQRLRGIRAVVFDVYGTMLACAHGEVGVEAEPTEAAIAQSMAAVGLRIRSRRVPAIARVMLEKLIAAHHAAKRARGVSYPEVEIRNIWRDVLRRLASDNLVCGGVTARRIERLAIGYECLANPCRPMPGLGPALDAMRSKGLRLGIVSNAQFYTPLILGALPVTGPRFGFFDPELCVWSYRLGVAKPSGMLVHIVLQRLARIHGIRPEQTLFVGNDMLNDALPAARAGARAALFAGDRRALKTRENLPECAGMTPSLVVASFAMLAGCV